MSDMDGLLDFSFNGQSLLVKDFDPLSSKNGFTHSPRESNPIHHTKKYGDWYIVHLPIILCVQNPGTLPDFIPWGSGYKSVYYGIWDSTPT